ncbi:glycosyltransferase [Pontibacter qinzhouensis]|uniref:Glycosyltransferase n=1 Tax=Pontibacter qinzhouensis TaxID=2603253 RepID=A0A5C8IQ99_9BACT|nr:glycosyltransferase [Pontibacter qinzhouensis]TXK23331.1 glycosyltransferase [Pontibacter qinzhouensis]
MKEHLPYKISHLYLHESLASPTLDSSTHGHYLVFWWRSVALAHFFIEPGQEVTEEQYYQKLVAVLEPSLLFYGAKPAANWARFVVERDVTTLSAFMNPLFEAFIPSSVPAKLPVSVVICTRNRARQLDQCIRMLQQLTCLPAEIVVIDNAPSDASSCEVVARFPDVTYVKEPRAGLDIARNTGVAAANYPIVAFVDDDVLVDPLWIYQVYQTFQNPEINAMTGLVIASELETEAQEIFEKHWSFNRGYTDVLYDTSFFTKHLFHGPPVWEMGAGANMAFRKSVFEKVGLFDEILDAGAAGCNGDSEMWYRILSHGFGVHYNPRAIVYHEHRRELGNLKKQIYAYMRGFTVAALLQQDQVPKANYKRRFYKYLPKHYLRLTIRGFPRYRSRNLTLWAEMKGIVAGFFYYRRNKQFSTALRHKQPEPGRLLKTA